MDLQQRAALLIAQKQWERIQQRAAATNQHPNDYSLKLAIEDALHAVDFIPAVLADLDEAIRNSPPEKKEYLEYQKWLAESQLKRAAEWAGIRKEHLRSLDIPAKQKAELELCRKDTTHWFQHWAWTADPRPDSPLYTVPFILFDFQKEGVDWLENLVFKLRSDGLIDKSRDMGVSWLTVTWAVKHWLFSSRQQQFHALFGSRKEDLVDKIGDMATMFEKMRFIIRTLPSWMLPEGFDVWEGMPYLRILNPETGSSLIGESSNANFGRAGRYTTIFFDEHAAFPDGGFAAWTAASQSSKSKISVSTPQGRLNKQAQLRYSGTIPVKSFKWDKHPWKDERWYNGQKLSMSDVEIAQELDISYDASQPGRVYPQYSELYHVITWPEFARVYPDAAVRDSTGKVLRYRIPPSWSLGRGQDWGSTESHPCVTLWMARAKEGAPLAGSVFVYREYIPPTGSTPNMVARAIKELEKPDNEGTRMALSVMSHEAKSERDTYNLEAQLPFVAWTTDYVGGIAQVNNYLEMVETQLPNPFAPELKGRPRLYFIVDEEQGMLKYDFESGSYWRIGAKDSKGLIRIRSEFPLYHYPETEEGKPVQKLRPFKRMDDAMDVLRCMASQWFPAIRPETIEEKIARQMPQELTPEAILKLPLPEQAAALHARQFKMAELRRANPPAMNWRKKVQFKRNARFPRL
jgi:hypothetical protein